jgi:hypothetical protein
LQVRHVDSAALRSDELRPTTALNEPLNVIDLRRLCKALAKAAGV